MAWQREPDWPRERLERTTAEVWKRVNPREPFRSQTSPLWHLDPCDLLLQSKTLWLGYLRRPHRLFAPLDVVLVRFTNGQGERCEAAGWSTRFRRFVLCPYIQYARYEWHDHRVVDGQRYSQHENRATLRLVRSPDELPGEIGKKPWFDPDVRRLAAEWLRAADSGSSLGTATGGAIE